MKSKFMALIFFEILFLASCVPQKVQEVETFVNKNADRKIASGNTQAYFDALTVAKGVRMGDREYVQSVFVDVFGPTAEALTRPYIYNKAVVFNGGCSQYEATYSNVIVGGAFTIDDVTADCSISDMSFPVVGVEGSVREGFRIQACEVAVNNANALFYLIDSVTGVTNVQASFTTNPTDAHITKIFEKFYPAQTISPEVLTSLKNIGAAVSLTTAKDRFKLITLTICMTADWQIP